MIVIELSSNIQEFGFFLMLLHYQVTCGMPSQSSACCMASRALSTGFVWSHWSQSGHRPAGIRGQMDLLYEAEGFIYSTDCTDYGEYKISMKKKKEKKKKEKCV